MSSVIQERNDLENFAVRSVMPIGLSSEWAELNPILDKGLFGVESDTYKVKVGDGISEWNELPYQLSPGYPIRAYANINLGPAIGDIRNIDLSNLPDGIAERDFIVDNNGYIGIVQEINGTIAKIITVRGQLDQAQVDWLETNSGNVSYIKNKPNIPANFATVASTGNYSDLTGLPTIPTVNNTLISINNYDKSTTYGSFRTNSGLDVDIDLAIDGSDIAVGSSLYLSDIIPSQVSGTNELADKAFVSSSIQNMAANYVSSNATGTNFATRAALLAGPYYHGGVVYTPDTNDYAIVAVDESQNGDQTRYIYDGTQWNFEYIVGSAFTAAQQLAIDSGVTSTKVSAYDSHISNISNPHSVTAYEVGLGNCNNTSDANKPVSTAQQAALDLKENLIVATNNARQVYTGNKQFVDLIAVLKLIPVM